MEAVEIPLNNFLFPTKLWQVVNDTKICAVIWNSRGNGIIIRQDLIESQVLALKIFKATSFFSFVRQLHYYSFKKSKRWSRDNPNIHHFNNPNFIRNHPELLPLVKRFPQRRWCIAQAAANATAQPNLHQSYGAVVPPYFPNVPQMPAESYAPVHPNPCPVHHLIPVNPNVFELNHFAVSGFWDSQQPPMAPYYFNPYGLYQMGYAGNIYQVPAPRPRAPVSLFRKKRTSSSTSVSQIVKIEGLSISDSSKPPPATKHPANNVQNNPASAAGAHAGEPARDAGESLLFLSKQQPKINAMKK